MITISLANANNSSNFATKDDVKAIRDDIRLLIHQMDKRFEQIDKRLDMMQHQMDKRFEQIDKRLDMMQHQMDKRFEQVDKRFEQIDKRLDMMQREIEERSKTTNYMMIAFFVLIMGYLLKERSLIKKDVKEELKPELFKKADKSTVEKIITAIEEFAKEDENFRKVLEKHHLRYIA